MVIDTSVLVAILADEPERPRLAQALAQDGVRIVSAVSVLEASLVILARYGEDGLDDLDLLLSRIGAEVREFAPADLGLARSAFARFGKGRHPAGLNFGDCFSHALAQRTGEPLLYKGEDFSKTDVASVTW